MHDPVTFPSIRSSALIKHEGLSHPNDSVLGDDGLIPSCRLPESGRCGPIRPRSGRILPVFVAKKVPFILFIVS